ncbi:MAG: M1 family aminopeptidase [Gemmatimonadales bacterium]
MRARPALTLLAFTLLIARTLPAQAPAATYDERYQEILKLHPTTQAIAVKGATITRDAGTLTFESGTLTWLSDVGGRTVAVAFNGKGKFRFVPPAGIERERVKLFRKVEQLDEPIDWAVLFFADSTRAELERQGAGAGTPDPKADDVAKKAVDLWTGTADFFKPDKDAHYVSTDLMATLLNAEQNGFFTAVVGTSAGDPLQFTVNPAEREAVSLTVKSSIGLVSRTQETISRFPRASVSRAWADSGERAPSIAIRSHVMDVGLPQSGSGDIRLQAATTLSLEADAAAGPWLTFTLASKLEVDSASWGDGKPAPFFKGHLNPYLWVRAPERLAKGATATLKLYYHGNIIERFAGELFTMEGVAFASWYPSTLDGRGLAMFDYTLHSPEGFVVSGVGERVDSSVANHVITTRWKTPKPIRNATFNLGIFQSIRLEGDSLPPVDIHWSDKVSRLLASSGMPAIRNPKEEIGGDIQNALKFYRAVYGDPPVTHLYAGEVPYAEGLAFPGMVDLSLFTSTDISYEGFDRIFRAHETAHQYWGIAVDFQTYHDQWLSEGFSDFSGLWYLQTRSGKNDLYFKVLDRWRDDILRKRAKIAPISLGYRMDTSLDESSNYSTIVYQKGAWVLHMLRILTLDMQSMSEEKFKGIMRDFYSQYRGRRASTRDFQAVVEQHVGQPMDWFFNQWVHGYQVPTYKVATRTEPTEDGKFRVKLRVIQENVPESFLMYVPVTLDLGNNRVARVRVKVTGTKTEVDLPLMPAQPKAVKFNDFNGALAEVATVGW